MPTVINFSAATKADCMRKGGVELNLDNISKWTPTLHLPEDSAEFRPSQTLCESLRRVLRFSQLDSEAARRGFLNMILYEALHLSSGRLMLHEEQELSWQGRGMAYTGRADYMIGTARLDSNLLVVEAKKEWSDIYVFQLLAEAGCLLNKRSNEGKQTPVFAVLTNGCLFKFFALDIDSVVYCSRNIMISTHSPESFEIDTDLAEVLRWLVWLIDVIPTVSVRAGDAPLNEDSLNQSLVSLRSCFGPRRKS
jgi:hypothetical protein